MGLKIEWSIRAESEFDQILNYWNERIGSKKYSNKLITITNQSIEKLSNFPESGRATDNPIIRYKIVRDYFLYYSFDETTLFIVAICDMRRNPEFIKSLVDSQ